MCLYPTEVRTHLRKVSVVGILSAIALTLVNPSTASAQRFDVLTPRISNKEAKALQRKVSAALRDPAAFQAGQKDVEKFFKDFYFPKMTSPAPADLGVLGKRRDALLNKLIRPTKVQEAQDLLTNMTLKAGRGMARGNFHPAVRYNATLMLGQLDKEIASGSNPPIPLPEGTAALLELLENDTLTMNQKKIKVSASVKAGALLGLERHARFGIAQDYTDRVTKAALSVITNKEHDDEVTSDVHHWMQCMAAKVLARQYKDGPDKAVQDALNSMLVDEKMSFEDRCSVVNLLDAMQYETSKIDGPEAVLALGKLTLAMAKEEAKESKEFEEQALAGAPINQRGRLNKANLGPEYPRNRLLNRLVCISTGAKSLAGGLQDAEKQKLAELITALQSVISTVEDKNSLDLDVTDSVQEMSRTVNRLVSGWLPAEAKDDEFAG